MPTIEAFPDPIRAYNRVEVNWADLPGVEFARVLRVDVESGECTPLRPYICFFGDYLKLSCGHGIFWDTEVPLDRQVYYITEGLDAPCVPSPDVDLEDTYTRNVVNGFGNATPTGQPWTIITGGVPADYLVNGTVGQVSITAVSSQRILFSSDTYSNSNITNQFIVPAAPTGGPFFYSVVARATDADNLYMLQVTIAPGGLIGLELLRRVGGVFTILSSNMAITIFTLGQPVNVRFTLNAATLTGTVWQAGPEPAPQLTATDTTFSTGRVGYRFNLNAGVTNPLPVVVQVDNLLVLDPCLPCTPVTVDTSATPVTMPSNGAFRLRDPVRPCNDMYVPLCFTQPSASDPNCIPGQGTFFASMDIESYDSNSLILNPTNASLPLSVNRARRGVTSVLNLVTRTFLDRDALLQINQPGSPLLWSGPPQYGIPDRYMSVGELSVERGVSDHKFQVRNILMPFVQVVRPAGPSNGVCGSRLADVCDIYETIDDLEAAGISWDDLIRGRASQDGGDPVGGYRTWADVLTEFPDWAGVLANGTWRNLLEGD